MPNIVGNLQRWFDGPAGHAEIIKFDNNNGTVDTLGTNFDGMKWRTQELTGEHCIIRFNGNINELHMLFAIHDCYNTSAHEYSFAGLFNAAFQQFMDDITFKTWRKHIPMKIGDRLFCSATVARCYEIYSGYKFHREGESEQDAMTVTPSDLLKDKDFTIIKTFG